MQAISSWNNQTRVHLATISERSKDAISKTRPLDGRFIFLQPARLGWRKSQSTASEYPVEAPEASYPSWTSFDSPLPPRRYIPAMTSEFLTPALERSPSGVGDQTASTTATAFGPLPGQFPREPRVHQPPLEFVPEQASGYDPSGYGPLGQPDSRSLSVGYTPSPNHELWEDPYQHISSPTVSTSGGYSEQLRPQHEPVVYGWMSASSGYGQSGPHSMDSYAASPYAPIQKESLATKPSSSSAVQGSEEKRYKCRFCEKTYMHESTKCRHEKEHWNSPYVCPLAGCGVSSWRKDSLRRHVRLMHPKSNVSGEEE